MKLLNLRVLGVGAALVIPVSAFAIVGSSSAGASTESITVSGHINVLVTATISQNASAKTVNSTSSTTFKTTSTTGHIKLTGTGPTTLKIVVTSAVSTGHNAGSNVTKMVFKSGVTMTLSGSVSSTTFTGCVITITKTLLFVTTAGKLKTTSHLTVTHTLVNATCGTSAKAEIRTQISDGSALSGSITATV
jgi:hypothetical protein